MLLQGGQIFENGTFLRQDILIENGIVMACGSGLLGRSGDLVFELNGMTIFPGFVDVHVHLREPGFSYKETIFTGSKACAHGGYTTVCAMPNLSPVPDCREHLEIEKKLIQQTAVIRVIPYASITMGQKGEGTIVDMAELAPDVCGFSDDGRGVKSADVMREAMRQCREAGSIIAAHCEDLSLIPKGSAIHSGRYASRHGLQGIPSESEWKPIARDVQLAAETGCRYHVCHVSCKESVATIRKAKASAVNITCETAPHYLLLSEDQLPDPTAADIGRFKMNPPLRSEEDRKVLIEALQDDTIDIIATDHAPHSAEEKARGLAESPMGIVGIECAFPLLYTYLVKKGVITLEQLIRKLCVTPRERFRIDGGLKVGDRAEITVFDLNASSAVDCESFFSKGRATPFEGWKTSAVCMLTISGDHLAYQAKEIKSCIIS